MTIRACVLANEQEKAYQEKLKRAEGFLKMFELDKKQANVLLRYLKGWRRC